MNQRLTMVFLALGAMAFCLLMGRCSAPPCPECPPEMVCPSVDVEARDAQIRALREMHPDARTEEIAQLLDECLR